jgi:hypothetical protein
VLRQIGLYLFLLLLAAPAHAQDPTALLGTWRLNVSKSNFASGPPAYSRVVFRIEPHDDGLKVVYDMIGTRGGVTHWEWTGKLDGKDYALQGVEEVVTNAYSRVDDYTFTIVTKVDGRPTGTTRIVVSEDRKIMTVTSPATDPRGQRVMNTAIYEKM